MHNEIAQSTERILYIGVCVCENQSKMVTMVTPHSMDKGGLQTKWKIKRLYSHPRWWITACFTDRRDHPEQK